LDDHSVINAENFASKSRNTPFDGARMQGKVLATYVAGERVYEKP
jgi:dihydroorotase